MDTLVNFPQQRFQLWDYNRSRKELLLRSPKSTDFPKRIDVLFRSVAYMSLPTKFTGLTMKPATPERSQVISQIFDSSLLQPIQFFVLQGQEYEGYVVANGYAVDESTRDYNEPSIWEWMASLLKKELTDDWEELTLYDRLNFGEPTSFHLPLAFWKEMGQRYGEQVRKDYSEKMLLDFIEGIKAGFAQAALGFWNEKGQTCGMWFRNDRRHASHLQHPEEALLDFIEGIKVGFAQIKPNPWQRSGQTYGKWVRDVSLNAGNALHYPEEALDDFIEGLKEGIA